MPAGDLDSSDSRPASIDTSTLKSNITQTQEFTTSFFDEILRAIGPHRGQGHVANYIPALAAVDPMKFGMTVALEGRGRGLGLFLWSRFVVTV